MYKLNKNRPAGQGICDRCCRWWTLEKHHVFNGTNKKNSEKHGALMYVCSECHRKIHDGEMFETKRIFQELIEKDMTREEFIKIFGKSWR